MTIVAMGFGKKKKKDKINTCSVSNIELSHEAVVDFSLLFTSSNSLSLRDFACVSSPSGGGGVPGSTSLCTLQILNVDDAASVNTELFLSAASQLNLVQLPNADLFGLGSGGGSSPGVEDSFSDKGIVNRNISRRINQTLYSLKRLWGGSFSIYSVGDATVNHLDGTQNEPATVIHVKRGIILPGKHIRDIKHTISMISANKAFVTGGTYDKTARTFIVDRVDAPNLDLTESDYIIYDNKRYEVKEFQEYEFDSAWVIAGQAIEGENPVQIRLLAADDLLRLDQSVIEVP